MIWNLLVIDDNKDNCNTIARALQRFENLDIYKSYDPIRGKKLLEEKDINIVITDLKMPSMDGLSFIREVLKKNPHASCVVLTAYGTIENAVEAMKIGAFEYLTKPINLEELRHTVQKIIRHQELLEENRRLNTEKKQKQEEVNFVFRSKTMQKIADFIQNIAHSDSPVLIQGESGTGKEVVARTIHRMSDRKYQEFIVLNCAAINESLLESELFGHEKGAFTGAERVKKGFFEVSHKGTLFLDEIGEMSSRLQSKLLRVLERGEFYRIGSTRTMKTDARILAATNKDLKKLVKTGLFRNDLFFRLNVFNVRIPPLRERREDIPELFDYFLRQYADKLLKKSPPVNEKVYNILYNHDWPGNVRELKNLVEYLMVLSKGAPILPHHFPSEIMQRYENGGKAMKINVGTSMKQIEKEVMLKTLENCNQNRTQAARMLGVSRRTLIRKIKEFQDFEAHRK